MPSVFDAPQGVMKADGQVHGQYQAPPPVAAPPIAAPPGAAAPAGPDPSVSGGIKALVQALAQALAPKAITQRKQKIDSDVAAATGDQAPLGNQFP